jgi:hypothetical protein
MSMSSESSRGMLWRTKNALYIGYIMLLLPLDPLTFFRKSTAIQWNTVSSKTCWKACTQAKQRTKLKREETPLQKGKEQNFQNWLSQSYTSSSFKMLTQEEFVVQA